jgi:excisionase family DNA binding protein
MNTLLLSKQEAAKMLGLSIRTLEYLISSGEISTRRIGKRVLITRTTVESFAEAASPTSSAEPPKVTGKRLR